MKSVIISIQPKDCELIVDEKMTIKVLKNRPKIETPFKCYIYCIYGQGLIEANDEILPNHLLEQKVSRYKTWGNCCNGKVIGEFVCDRIYEIKNLGSSFMIGNDIALTNRTARESCLEFPDLLTYLKDKNGYAWHISDLKIYDKPKELSEFKRWNRTEENSPCAHTKWLYPDCKDCKECNLIKSPKSWCYVEEI